MATTARIIVFLGIFGSMLAAERATAQPQSASVSGTVSVVGADGQPFVVPGVTLTLTCGKGDPQTEVSDSQGAFRFADVPTATCAIVADLQGFKSATTTVAVKAGEPSSVALQLGLDTLHEEVTVNARDRKSVV